MVADLGGVDKWLVTCYIVNSLSIVSTERKNMVIAGTIGMSIIYSLQHPEAGVTLVGLIPEIIATGTILAFIYLGLKHPQ